MGNSGSLITSSFLLTLKNVSWDCSFLQNSRQKTPLDPETRVPLLNEQQQRILEQLDKQPFQGYKKLGENLNLGRRKLESLLSKNKDHSSLRELGLVNKTTHGWKLTNRGEEICKDLYTKKPDIPK